MAKPICTLKKLIKSILSIPCNLRIKSPIYIMYSLIYLKKSTQDHPDYKQHFCDNRYCDAVGTILFIVIKNESSATRATEILPEFDL